MHFVVVKRKTSRELSTNRPGQVVYVRYDTSHSRARADPHCYSSRPSCTHTLIPSSWVIPRGPSRSHKTTVVPWANSTAAALATHQESLALQKTRNTARKTPETSVVGCGFYGFTYTNMDDNITPFLFSHIHLNDDYIFGHCGAKKNVALVFCCWK